MNRLQKKLLALALLLFFPAFVHKELHDQTGNFRLAKIATDLPQENVSSCDPGILHLLDQKFYYLAKGHHTYAFISEDKKTVLKFPRYHKFAPSFWLRLSLLPKELRNQKICAKKDRFRFFFDSHYIAYEHLKEETGVLYVHLKKTNDLQKKVTIVDRFQREYQIDIDEVGFAVQKYYPLYQEKFGKFFEEKSEDEIRTLFAAYFEVIASRYAKGIVNKDRRGWGRNYGIDSKQVAFEIDLGSYEKKEDRKKSMSWEIKECSKDFRKWVRKHAPSYLSIFDEEYKKALEITCFDHKKSRDLKKASYF